MFRFLQRFQQQPVREQQYVPQFDKPTLPPTVTGDGLLLSRDEQRKAARELYRCNPLMSAAVDTMTALVNGNGVTYGAMTDNTAYEALEEYYTLNDLDQFSVDLTSELLLDGEALIILADDVNPTEAGRIHRWDVATKFNLITEPGIPTLVTGVEVPTSSGQWRTLEPHQFVYVTTGAKWNDPRGWPTAGKAITAARNYARLLEHRVRLHELRGRLNGIYKAFAQSQEELNSKASRFANVPPNGNVVVLWKDRVSGQSEELDFTNPGTQASDAEKDITAQVHAVAMTFSLPEHYLSFGGDVNLATAQAMSEPTIRAVEKWQQLIVNTLTHLFRLDLTRRYGDRLFAQEVTEVINQQRVKRIEYVPASELTIPWTLPNARAEDAQAMTARARTAFDLGLASKETLSALLGFDWALELERMGASETPADDDAPTIVDTEGE